MKKIACVFSQIGVNEYGIDRYNSLANVAINSFKKFHPDVDVFHITESNIEEYVNTIKGIELYDAAGVNKIYLSKCIMEHYKFDKIIVLDIDTITCSRLDEFIDNDSYDVLCTLNYPCIEKTKYWETPTIEFTDENNNKFYDYLNINGGAMCFNNIDSLNKVIELSINHFTGFSEQGALNELALVDKSYTVHVVDFPYKTSKVVYNARSKGVFGTAMCNKNTPQYRFYVKDNKLYTEDNKHIKLWHYIEGLGDQNNIEFQQILNNWIFNLFNDETKRFFKDHCCAGKFFEAPYNINESL